jgi:Zn-dependent protease with chaperone function
MNSVAFSAAVRARGADGARLARVLWPVALLVPLSWWADRGCNLAGVDPLYHAVMWVHERLGWCLAVLAIGSASVVAVQIIVARQHFLALVRLAEPMPRRLEGIVDRVAREFGVDGPQVVYLDIDAEVATTVFGSTILLSRGFVERLADDDETELVVRHELAHVARRDGTLGVLWHLAFAALLIPGFGRLEAALHAGRERRANLVAAEGRVERYLALVERLAGGPTICVSASLDLGPVRMGRAPAWLAPVVVLALGIALIVSHITFERDLGFLTMHHC